MERSLEPNPEGDDHAEWTAGPEAPGRRREGWCERACGGEEGRRGAMSMIYPPTRAEFRPNFKKILETILFIIARWPAAVGPTQYEIVKSVFVADLEHTNKYGRPVTFDNYSALYFGPVPENTYDAIKPGYKWFRRNFGIDGPLWDVKPAGGLSKKALNFYNLKREPNLRALSQSDIACLVSAMNVVKSLGFAGVRDWTHEHPACKDAWERRGDKQSSPMYFENLIAGEDEDLMHELVHASKHIS